MSGTNTFQKKIIFWIFCLGMAVMVVLFLRRAGSTLVKADPIIKSDAIVVLMGSIPDRVLHTADLYMQGIAPRIIIVDPEHGSWEKVISRGIHPTFGVAQFMEVAVLLGIPDSYITVLPGEAESTRQEAQIISSWLKQNPGIKKLILVSSNNHTLRSGMIFRKKFKKEGIKTEILLSPSPYTKHSDLSKWWTDREKIEVVVFEWMKIVAFIVVEQWTL